MSRTCLILGLALLAGCSEGTKVDASDASVAAVGIATDLRAFPAIDRLLPKGGRLESQRGAWSLAPTGFRPTSLPARVARLPARANQAVRLEASPDLWLELTDAHAREVVGSVDGAILTFPAALPDTDLAWAARLDGVEDLRILRSERAPKTLRFHVRLGPGLTHLRAHDGRIEALDREGRPRFATAPAFAVDARGTRRDLALALDEGAVVARLDTTGMLFPIAVDPTWQITTVDPPTSLTAWGSSLVALDGRRALLTSLGSPSGALFDATNETWTAVAGLSLHFRGAVWVPSVNKLVTGGGSDGSVWTSGAEIFDGTSLAATTSNLLAVRGYHTAELITTTPERVLFIGGLNGATAQATTEWWDSSTGTFTARASMLTPRNWHASSRLASGKILVTGGLDTGILSLAEIYDPVANTWTATINSMGTIRYQHRQVTLKGGKVLVVGGSDGTSLSTTELFDPGSNTFVAGPSMKDSRANATVTLRPDGTVVVAGGSGLKSGDTVPGDLPTTEIYDPVTNSFAYGPSMSAGRSDHGAVLLSGGRVLVGPGTGSARAEILWPDPVACTTGSCPNCVDGVCCDSPCTGQCEACDVAGKKGVCSPIDGEAPHGSRASCGAFGVCQVDSTSKLSACITTCVSDASCAAGNYCSGGACLPKKANGAACGRIGECTSSFCADGVCCNTGCPGVCEACAESSTAGTCTPISGPPRGTRVACSAGYACSAGTCTSTCTKDLDCATGYHCDTASKTCVTAKALGSACTSGSQCPGGNCVDGVCCDTVCKEPCKACNLTGFAGVCSAVTGAPVGARTCAGGTLCAAGACATGCTKDADCATGNYCSGGACLTKKTLGNGCGSASECGSGFCATGVCCDTACTGECQACNVAGPGTCGPRPATAACGLAGCVGSATVGVGTCSGTSNTCNPGTVTPCPNGLKCADAFGCLPKCTTAADCLTGACDFATGKCSTGFDAGLPDTGVDPDTGAVTDVGVAESSAPTVDPKPVVGSFEKCSKNSECATGFCVEGICCDTACDDKCHSCALLGSAGKCTLEPIGVDLKSECGPALSCLGTCDGKGACIGAGKGTMCARNRCTGASAGIGPSYCAAPGAKCTTDDAVNFDCAPYTCEPAFGACRSNCVSSSDCANGYVCDLGAKSCIVAPTVETAAAAEEDGGCGCRAAGRGNDGPFGLLGLAALIALLRQRGSSA